MKKTCEGENVLLEFFTWGEYVRQAESAPSPLSTEQRASRRHGGGHGDGWAGTDTFEEALELAHSGDVKQFKTIEKEARLLLDSLSANIERQDTIYDVEGRNIDIARFVDNEPECWMDFTPTSKKSIVEVTVCIGGNCSVTAETLRRKGMASMILVQLLELNGYRVGVTIAETTQRSDAEFVTLARVKEPNQPMDGPRLAFAICHPASFRRLWFSIAETLTADECKRWGIRNDGGYGCSVEIPKKYRGKVYIGPAEGAIHVETDKDMKEWVLQQAEKCGVKIKRRLAKT